MYFTSYINVSIKWALLSAKRCRIKQVFFAGGPSTKLSWSIKLFSLLLRAYGSCEKLQAERNYCCSFLRQASKVQDFPVSPSLLQSLLRTELESQLLASL